MFKSGPLTSICKANKILILVAEILILSKPYHITTCVCNITLWLQLHSL